MDLRAFRVGLHTRCLSDVVRHHVGMAPSTRLHQDALFRILDQQLEVITRRQALDVGLTRHALGHRLRPGGPWRSLLPGVYMAATGTPTTLQQETAALLYAGSGSMITGPAALRCHHIGKAVPDLIDVLVPAERRRHDAGDVRLHRTTRWPGRIWQVGPVRYVPPSRAVADAVRGMDNLRDVRAVVADAVQRRACQVRELAAELAGGQNTGSALFRVALADVAEGIRSVTEADLKDLLVKARVPMPLFNASLFDADGTFIARPDAWWPELGIAIEVDSREWHLSPEDHAEHARPGPAHGPLPDRGAQVHPQAATVRTRDGHRGNPPHARRRPRPPATEPPHRPGQRSRHAEPAEPKPGRRTAEAEAEAGQPLRESA